MSVPGYAKSVLAFACGYLLAGAALNAFDIWAPGWWHRSQSTTPQFEFIESLIFVLVFGILSVTSYLVGAVIRSVTLTLPDYPSAGRAALLGSVSFVGLWLIALKAPMNRAVTLAFVAVIPAVLGYWVGRRRRQKSG